MRLNKYVFPTTDCVVAKYAKLGRPADFSGLLRCLEDFHWIRGKRSLDIGLSVGIENGFIREVWVGRRRGYVPSMEGVVYTGIYFGLEKAKVTFPTDVLPCLLNILRNFLMLKVAFRLYEVHDDSRLFVPQVTDEVVGRVKEVLGRYGVDDGVARDVVYTVMAHVHKQLFESELYKKYEDYTRDDLIIDLVTLKALAGVEVRDLTPKGFKEVMKRIEDDVVELMNLSIKFPRVTDNVINFDNPVWLNVIVFLRHMLNSACNSKLRVGV
jgi:hypothetical protein